MPALLIVGVCEVDVKLFGPVQLKVNPPGLALNVRFWPAHTGALEVTVGEAGVLFTTTLIVPAALLHPSEFTIKEYTPAAAVVVPTIFGFCVVDVHEFGPVQL